MSIRKGRAAEYHSCKQFYYAIRMLLMLLFLTFVAVKCWHLLLVTASGCFPRLSSYWQMPQAISRLSQSEVLMSFRRSGGRAKSLEKNAKHETS